MERNDIFSMDRFLGLIGTGINRRKHSFVFGFAVATGLIVTLMMIDQLLSILEYETAKRVIIRFYQIGFVFFLAVPAFRITFNEDKSTQWNLLPASAFEKYLYFIFAILVWRTIVYCIAVYGLDYVVWAQTPFSESMGINQCHIGLKELFTFGFSNTNLPQWAYYSAVFFYYASLAIVTGIGFNSATNHTHPDFSYVYLVQLVLTAFIRNDKWNDSIQYVVLAGFAVFFFIYNIIVSIKRSCNVKA